MSAAVVQHRSTTGINVTSVALAFSSNVTAGSLLAYLSSDFPTGTILAATDNNSNTIALAASVATTDGDNRCDYVASANSGATTVTGHGNAGGADMFLHIYEISGCVTSSPVRDSGNAHSATGSVSTAGSTSLTGDAVLAFFSDSPQPDTLTVGAGYSQTELQRDAVTNNESCFSEFKAATAGGTQTATCGGNATDVLVMLIVTFKVASGAGLLTNLEFVPGAGGEAVPSGNSVSY